MDEVEEKEPVSAEARRPTVCPRDVITTKLLEGYLLDGNMCGMCAMPTMMYNGVVSCVVCTMTEYPSCINAGTIQEYRTNETNPSSNLEDRDEVINRITSAYSERREEVTEIYTAKIMEGYSMCRESCGKCEMPMMCYESRTRCIFCQDDTVSEKMNPGNAAAEDLAPIGLESKTNTQEGGDKADDASTNDSATDLEVMVDPQEGADYINEATLERSESSNGIEAETVKEDTDQRRENDILSEEARDALTRLLDEEGAASRSWQLMERLQAITAQKKHGNLNHSRLDAAEHEIMQMIQFLEVCENQSFEEFNSRKQAAFCVLSKIEMKGKDADAADSNVILEADCFVKKEGHNNKEPIEGWDTRLFEGRALMNRRRLLGWTILEDLCAGKNCNKTPLMQSESGFVECVVCRGTGSGEDGVYADCNNEKYLKIAEAKNTKTTCVNISNEGIPQAVMIDDSCEGVDKASFVDEVVTGCTKQEVAKQDTKHTTWDKEEHMSSEDEVSPSLNSASLGCSAGEVLFPGLRTIFSNMSQFIKKDLSSASKMETQLEARQKINQLVDMGWEVSPNRCPSCDMPLFTKVCVIKAQNLCVLCGEISSEKYDKTPVEVNPIGPSDDDYFKERVSHEMAEIMIAGWTISRHACNKCMIPYLADPGSNKLICVGCRLVSNTRGAKLQQSNNSNELMEIDNEHEIVSRRMVNLVMSGWVIIEGMRCPLCATPMMRDPMTHLIHCVICNGQNKEFGRTFQERWHSYGSPLDRKNIFVNGVGSAFPTSCQYGYPNGHNTDLYTTIPSFNSMRFNRRMLHEADFEKSRGRDPTPTNSRHTDP